MADNFQTTAKTQSDSGSDADSVRVIFRGRLRIETGDFAAAGSGFRASTSIDLSQYNIGLAPSLDVYVSPSGDFYKAPFTIFSSSGAVTQMFYFYTTTGTKTVTSNKLWFFFWSTASLQTDIYIQILSTPSVGAQFPLLSSS